MNPAGMAKVDFKPANGGGFSSPDTHFLKELPD
jgi:hypothetical protein